MACSDSPSNLDSLNDDRPMTAEPSGCLDGDAFESRKALAMLARRLAVRVYGRQTLQQMLRDYVDLLYGMVEPCDRTHMTAVHASHKARDRDRLTYELSRALRDVADMLDVDVAHYFIRSANDVEESVGDHPYDAIASWVDRARRRGVSRHSFLELGM